MAEQLDLTTPVVTPTVTSWHVEALSLRRRPLPIIQIIARSNAGQELIHVYSGDVARTLLNTLNTMNFTVNSLEKRVLQRLSADGILVGTVSGTPGD